MPRQLETLREKIERDLAFSLDHIFYFPEWGAHNRAMLRSNPYIRLFKSAGAMAVSESFSLTQADWTIIEDLLDMSRIISGKIRLEVDDAELNLNQARGNLALARRDYLAALVNLKWTTGVLGEGDVSASP